MAVCDKTYQLLTQATSPYAQDVIGIEPYHKISLAEAPEFNCEPQAIRHPQETKGQGYNITAAGTASSGSSCCSTEECC